MAQVEMFAAKANSPATELTAAITDVATTVSVLDASKLPDAPNIATIGVDETAETVKYTGKSGNTLTGVTRGFSGTVAKAWGVGVGVARYFTAYDADALRENVVGHSAQLAETTTKTELTSAIAPKANITYVDTKVAAIDRGYGGTYTTLTALQTAFPTGNANRYVVSADGNWYYWSGSAWTSGGVFQGIGIADGVVDYSKLSTDLSKPIDYTNNLFIGAQILNDYTVVNPLTPISVGDTRIIGNNIEVGRIIESVKIRAYTAGLVVMKLVTKNIDGTFNFIKDFIATIVVGENTVPINEKITLENSYMGMFNPVGGAQVFYQGGLTGATSIYKFTGELIGDNKTPVATTNNTVIALAIKKTYDANDIIDNVHSLPLTDGKITQLSTDIETISQTVNNVVSNNNNIKLLDKYSLARTTFATLPEAWVNNGFTLNNGLQSPVTGGTGITAYWNVVTMLDAHTVRARVKIVDTSSSFALFKRDTLHGGIGVVDCQAKTLSLHKAWTGGALPAVKASIPITLSIVVNREYVVTLKKTGSIHELALTDTVTGISNTVSFDNSTVSSIDYSGKQWGSPGVMFLSGNILIRKFEYVSNAPKNPKVLVMGDSITEGYGLDNGIATYEDRWCAKIRSALNGNAVMSGRGGGTSADIVARLEFDLDKFEPQYVTILIGANDTNLTTWQTNINTIITRILAKNAIPILCALPSGTLRVEMSAYLRTLPHTVVGFDYACSTSNNGITINQSLFSDGLHPNKAGNLKMYNQLLLDAPELFE